MIDAFETYVKYVPDAPERVVIMYREARIYYEYNHFDDAAKRFEVIVEKYPKHELAIYSANLLLDSLNAQGKTKEVVTYVDKFLEMPDLMKDPEFGKQMISLKSDTYDIEGHEYEKQKNFKECARSFQAAAEAMPDHAKHAERRWNEAQCFQNAHLVGQALQGAARADPRRTRRIRWRSARCSASPPATTSWPTTRRRPRATRSSPTSSRARRRRPTRSATRPPSASASARSSKALDDMESFVKFYGSAQAAGRRRRLLPDGRRLRARQEVRRPGQAPRELPQEVGRAGWSGSPGAGALPSRRAGLEGVVPEGQRRTAPAWRSSASRRPAARRCSTT